MATVRILVLDTPLFFHQRPLEEAGLTVELTCLEDGDTWSGGYMPSQRAKLVAANASLDDYDFVIIGNNCGMGLTFAALLPEPLRSRARIVWNSTSSRGESPYQRLGYEHFGTRQGSEQWVIDQVAQGASGA